MKTLLRATMIASVFCFASSVASAQGIALLDVGYVFKGHPSFKQQMDAMKSQVQQFEQQMRAQQEQIQAASKRIADFKPGTPEYKQLEERTTKQLADLKVQMQLKRKEIMQEEAKIYMATYQQVNAAVAKFAKTNRILLVLRYDRNAQPSAEAAANPQETLKIINQPVIFQSGIDISDDVLKLVGGTAVARRQPAQPTR